MLALLDTSVDLLTEPMLEFAQRTGRGGRSLGAVCCSCWTACAAVCVGSVVCIVLAVELLLASGQ